MTKFYTHEIEGKKIYLKKSGENFRVVHPITNDDGSFNWFNFLTGGSINNLVIIAIIVAIILGAAYEYSSNIQMFLDCFATPQQLDICADAYAPWRQKEVTELFLVMP